MKCKDCMHSGQSGTSLICWLYSVDVIVRLNEDEDSEGCDGFTVRKEE